MIAGVTTGPKGDRRRQARFPQNLKVSVTPLPEIGAKRSRSTISGSIHNISQGGLCVITPRPLDQSSLLRCEIAIGEAPVKISTLVEVVWTEKQKLHPQKFLSGLLFLL
jgi:PilZ domain